MRELQERDALPIVLLNLGNVYEGLGDLDRARDCFEEAIAVGRTLSNQSVSAPLAGLGMVLLRQGDLKGARARLAESLQARLKAGERRGVALAFTSFAQLAQTEQQPERAAQLMAAADAIRTAIGAPIQPRARRSWEQLVEEVRAALGETAFDKAWESGSRLTLEQAANLALSQSR
jgi:tetratricopeptide (TPR) repeat protein